jgi:transposase InsO family protein
MVASGFLFVMDNLYVLDTIAFYNETLNNKIRNVRQKLTHQDSAAFWHKRLDHISQQRIIYLVQSEILQPLNMSNLGPYIECAKGKKISMRKYIANRMTDVLELIHMDIYGPFPTTTRNDHVYFISFIDNYSRYCYIYLIKEKSQALDTFKSFKSEVELQLNKMIKDVRSDHGGEYYGRSDGSGEQRPGPFAKFLEDNGIVPQYTMPNSPTMNGVAERRNRTLMEMVRSMIPYELWTERKPSLQHFRIWDCPAEARPYRPQEKKLDEMTVSCYFIGYAERSHGYKFYDPTNKIIFEINTVKFFEDVMVHRRNTNQIVFEESQDSSIQEAPTSVPIIIRISEDSLVHEPTSVVNEPIFNEHSEIE